MAKWILLGIAVVVLIGSIWPNRFPLFRWILTLWDKLSGKSQTSIEIANSIDPDRIDHNGNLIPIGAVDTNGMVQGKVVEIDRVEDNSVIIKDGDVEVSIPLPTGVTEKDLDKVVVLTPGQFIVTVKSTSTISAQNIDDILKRYSA